MIDRKKILTAEFNKRYGSMPELWTRAPGRVDLMGSHTDYNEGFVMTMAIDRDTWIAAKPRTDDCVRIYSLNLGSGSEFSLDDLSHDHVSLWTNYVRAVAKFSIEAGYTLVGFDGLVQSTVPFSAGLSSSAALEMAVAMMFQAVGGFKMDRVEMALIGRQAENRYIGVKSGVLDQYSSVMGEKGKTILLDCRSLSHSLISMRQNLAVVICDTKIKRNLPGSEYDHRRRQCEQGLAVIQNCYPDLQSLREVSMDVFLQIKNSMSDVVRKRCQFVIEENQRVLDLELPLEKGDPVKLNNLFSASYSGARDLFEIVVPGMESMYQAMLKAPGIIAARQAGAGFGGCMVALVEPEAVEDFKDAVISEYQNQTGIDPDIYQVKPSQGASIIEG